MRQDMPNIDLLPIEMNRCNQAILVPTNIEDHQIIHHIRAGKYTMEIMKTGKVIGLHDPKPSIQRGATVGMLLHEGAQRFARDDVHRISGCQRAKQVRMAQRF